MSATPADASCSCATCGRLRRHRGGEGHRLELRHRRTSSPDRCQRRRQDHHPQRHRRHLPIAGGELLYDGKASKSLPAPAPAPGLALVPEGRGIFTRLTVEENLRMAPTAGATTTPSRPTWSGCSPCCRGSRERLQQVAARCRAASSRWSPSAARCCRGPLLLLDEPSMGLAPLVVEKIFEVIVRWPPRA